MGRKRRRGNKRNRGIYNVCVLVIIGMILYPPYQFKKAGLQLDLDYAFVWDPPFGGEINLIQLGIQILAVIAIGFVLTKVLK